MPQVHIILVDVCECTYVDGVYQNLEDAEAELNNPAYGNYGDERYHARWADGGRIETCELK